MDVQFFFSHIEIIYSLFTLSIIVVLGFQWRKISHDKELYEEINRNLELAKHDLHKKELEEQRLTIQQRILNRIVNCASQSLAEEDDFILSMEALANELKDLYESEYCSIGKVVDSIVEDYVVAYDYYDDKRLSELQAKSINLVRSVELHNENYKVCTALKSDEEITYYDETAIDVSENRYYRIYADYILRSKSVKNTTIIPIRDTKQTYGYLQFINSRRMINIADISPFKGGLLQLIQLIIKNKERESELIQNKNLLKDTNFFRDILEKKDDVDGFFDAIMEYLSHEFNAAVITFRIPLLDGYERSPIFYLRRCYVNKKVQHSQRLLDYYYRERMIKRIEEMGGGGYLKCINKDSIIEDVAMDTDYYEEYGLDIKESTLIMPIIRDDGTNNCRNPQRTNLPLCAFGAFPECVNRFEKLFGVFKLRIIADKKEDDVEDNVSAIFEKQEIEEKKERLQHLSKQISILLNSLVEKDENESLLVFQEKLRDSSFTKIKNFDQTCVDAIKDTMHAKACALYRFDDLNKILRRSASIGQYEPLKKKKNIAITEKDNILVKILEGKCTRYLFSFGNNEQNTENTEPALFVPMKKKDGSCAGVIVAVGREDARHSVSTAYWEHDKTHVDFIVDVLNRISESDTERLIFLQQLSHELLIPITNIVNNNDLVIETAERNKSSYTKEMLLDHLRSNLQRNMLFKYIVSDVENIFSTSNMTIQYTMCICERPKELLLDAIRMLEPDAHATKGLSIVTSISEMPPMMLDKERIMQVFINILKNAIRYSDKNSTIEVYYKFTDGLHEIKFVNYGIGIPVEDTEMIFELFSRSKNAKEAEVRGSGMGLYIVKSIMKAHGGDCVIRKHHQPTEISLVFPNKIPTL